MSDTIVTILMPLANESGESRPAKAMRLREDIYVVMGPVPEGETWKFPPGSEVKRKSKIMPNGKEEMVATAP